ncbi:conserved hypothetical protein [Culex quinquefasciatus]|uniref:Uncharacterized protein n=1 Tax=Culex quinquefasciatus TaxID=7176 RepID=B0WJK7_CULQU|nr:conserved hypothetical protein [Culex quinquefasciatus]|eukprot:XP_001848891.1 conserved hypothetical protein [Culex quinquefasciatus]
MKPPTFILLLLLASPTTATFTPEALDYVLRCIEYEASVAGGTLTLILYDLAPMFPFDNILNAILQSPRLEHVVKYVVNGSYHANLVNLPWHPSMFLIHPGYDVAHLMRSSADIKAVLKLFNPTTKVLVFVDFNNMNLVVTVFEKVFNVGFVSMVFFDSVAMRADLWNRVSGMRWTRVPPPMYLFTWMRRVGLLASDEVADILDLTAFDYERMEPWYVVLDIRIMKPSTLILLLLLSSPTSATYTPEALDYVLRCVEYEASVAGGTLSLILYDIAPKNPFDNILNAILQSPRLAHVVKYVVNGTYQEDLVALPWHPSMLLIHPGSDVRHLMRPRTSRDMKLVLELFNPTAKALVFVDFNNFDLLGTVFQEVFNVGFVSMVFFDSVAMRADLWNRISGMRWTRVPPPLYLFTWIRRSMTGVNITYYRDLRPLTDFDWNVRWVKEVASYLNTQASQYLTYCDPLSGVALQKCLTEQKQQLSGVDIKLETMQMHLEAYPSIASQSMFRKMFVQGSISVFDTVPGVGLLVVEEVADVLDLTAFDYERMEPWYVVLDITHQEGSEFFQTRWRYENLEIFRYVRSLLLEAGVVGFWKHVYRSIHRDMCIGRRHRVQIENKVDLDFEDMQPAWVALLSTTQNG